MRWQDDEITDKNITLKNNHVFVINEQTILGPTRVVGRGFYGVVLLIL